MGPGPTLCTAPMATCDRDRSESLGDKQRQARSHRSLNSRVERAFQRSRCDHLHNRRMLAYLYTTDKDCQLVRFTSGKTSDSCSAGFSSNLYSHMIQRRIYFLCLPDLRWFFLSEHSVLARAVKEKAPNRIDSPIVSFRALRPKIL